jgi:hypothetical protein
MGNVLFTFGRVGVDKVLVNGQANQIDSIQERMALEFAQTVSMGTLVGRKCQ